MIRTLLIIAGASGVLALATLGGAAALGGNDLARHGWAWTIRDGDGDAIRFERADKVPPQPTVSRTLPWTGGNSLILDLPVDVTYVQGEQAGVAVIGPRDLVDRVTLADGRLTLSGDERTERVVVGFDFSDEDREPLRITVTAPAVTRFDILGSSDLDIQAFDQPALTLTGSGSGDVTASGSTRALTLELSGSGDADLSSLQSASAVVTVSGSGDAVVAPTEEARLNLTGSGDVRLATRPAKVASDVSGSGDVDRS